MQKLNYLTIITRIFELGQSSQVYLISLEFKNNLKIN